MPLPLAGVVDAASTVDLGSTGLRARRRSAMFDFFFVVNRTDRDAYSLYTSTRYRRGASPIYKLSR